MKQIMYHVIGVKKDNSHVYLGAYKLLENAIARSKLEAADWRADKLKYIYVQSLPSERIGEFWVASKVVSPMSENSIDYQIDIETGEEEWKMKSI